MGLAVLSVIACGATVLHGEQRGARTLRDRLAPASTTQARISGAVITRDAPPRPVRGATVRARDGAGRIVDTTTTDQAGQFAFALARAGTYYVELVDETGRVLAVEDVGEAAVSVAAGQNSTTILRVPGRLPVTTIGRAARTLLGAASAAGVGALTATGQPASPER
jgi:hypothetical protein